MSFLRNDGSGFRCWLSYATGPRIRRARSRRQRSRAGHDELLVVPSVVVEQSLGLEHEWFATAPACADLLFNTRLAHKPSSGKAQRRGRASPVRGAS